MRPAAVEAVRRAATDLGYRPNLAARSLARGRSDSIGLIITEWDLGDRPGSFFAQPLRGAMGEVSRRSQQLVLLLASPNEAEDDRVRRYLDGSHVDGALAVLETHSAHLPEMLQDTKVPVVYLGRPQDRGGEGYSFVDLDNRGGGRLATQEMVERGRTVIGTISGPSYMHDATERVAGWREALEAAGLRVPEPAEADFTAEGGEAAMARLLEEEPDLDGVFIASDLMATGALKAIRESGRRVPDDLSVVGFDDSIFAVTSSPPLTSVRQPLEEMGRLMVETLLAIIADPAAGPIQRILPAELERRSSV